MHQDTPRGQPPKICAYHKRLDTTDWYADLDYVALVRDGEAA